MIRARPPRGSTMLETLFASAILIIGLTGVVTMMLRSSTSTREGATAFNAAAYGAGALQELTALGYWNLTVTGPHDGGSGPLDAGTVLDGAGRRYGRLAWVSDTGLAAAPSRLVEVQVEFQDALGHPRTTTTSTLIGRAPDAG